MPLYLIDAGRHLLYKQALLLSLADQAGEEGEAVIVGPGGARRGLWRNIRRGWGRPRKYRDTGWMIIGCTLLKFSGYVPRFFFNSVTVFHV